MAAQDHQQHMQQVLAATGLLLLEAQHKQQLLQERRLLAVGAGMACRMMMMIC